jgi:cytochrome c biogenesis protein CcdA
MMLFYGMGHCMLIVAVGTSAGAARHLIGSARLHRANTYVKRIAGALLALVGLYIAGGAMFPDVVPMF